MRKHLNSFPPESRSHSVKEVLHELHITPDTGGEPRLALRVVELYDITNLTAY
jgi:hypothetical protein